MSTHIENYKSGEVRTERHMDDKNNYHRVDGPAIIHYAKDGSILSEKWFSHNRLHRDGGPAVTDLKIHPTHSELIYQYHKNHKLHREDGPAYICNTHYKDKSKVVYDSYYIEGRKFTKNEHDIWQLNNVLKQYNIIIKKIVGTKIIGVKDYDIRVFDDLGKSESIMKCSHDQLETKVLEIIR